jgi:hypothetical protein
MLSRIMAPAVDKIAAIEVKNFIGSIVGSEYAIKTAIIQLKIELIVKYNGGCGKF